jgi:hypothetical protein
MLKTTNEEFYVITHPHPFLEFECEIYGPKICKTWWNNNFHLKIMLRNFFIKLATVPPLLKNYGKNGCCTSDYSLFCSSFFQLFLQKNMRTFSRLFYFSVQCFVQFCWMVCRTFLFNFCSIFSSFDSIFAQNFQIHISFLWIIFQFFCF